MAADKSAAKSTQGRDPYGLLKTAIASVPDEQADRAASRKQQRGWRKHRAEYSRETIAAHHRINGHLTQMIKARNAALSALPEELQAEARALDYTLLPIERRIFTDSMPIPDFQDKLIRTE